jgi:CRP-like cAMP-binding protein
LVIWRSPSLGDNCCLDKITEILEEEAGMASGELGKVYTDGEVIICEGDEGKCMYVIQDGEVEVFIRGDEGNEIRLGVRGAGEFFGEMAIFDRDVRSATVRALGEARVLTVDKKNFMRRVHEDPSLAFRLVETMSRRIRELGDEVARLQNAK